MIYSIVILISRDLDTVLFEMRPTSFSNPSNPEVKEHLERFYDLHGEKGSNANERSRYEFRNTTLYSRRRNGVLHDAVGA